MSLARCSDHCWSGWRLFEERGIFADVVSVIDGNVWSANLNLRDSSYESNCISYTENGSCMSYETERIFAFDDGFGDCCNYQVTV